MSTDDPLREKANRIAQQTIIVDGHIDLPYRMAVKNFQLTRELLGIPIQSAEGDFDYVRAKAGGLNAPFMSIYIPARYQKTGGAKEYADSLITLVKAIAQAHPDTFAVATSPYQVKRQFKNGILSLPMGMENGAPIEDDLQNVNYFHKQGIRYITLTHSRDNQICDSSYDTTGTWGGLSPFGRDVVKRMNEVGIIIDISHVSDQTFYQVMELTKVPVIASHSSARKFTPGFERNMNDEMIKALAKNNGVIMINFGSTFLDINIRKQRKEVYEQMLAFLKDKGLSEEDEAAKPIIEEFYKNNPKAFADVELVADHIDHVVSLVGVNHIGFGSDYDGVGDSLPTGLKDVSAYPNLIYVLLKRGYSESEIQKMCSGNVLRVWKAVEGFARGSMN